jgi:hypothetical protein
VTDNRQVLTVDDLFSGAVEARGVGPACLASSSRGYSIGAGLGGKILGIRAS